MIGAALLSLLALSVPGGPSDDPVLRAKELFNAGREAYEAKSYAVATRAFEDAYQLAPRPTVLFSLAQAHRQQFLLDHDPARLRRAVELFELYVRQVPSGGRRDHAAQHLADLSPILAGIEAESKARGLGAPAALAAETRTQIMVHSPQREARASIGDEEPDAMPYIRDVAPGPHRVRVEAPGYNPRTLELVAVQGRLVTAEAELVALSATVRVEGPSGARILSDGRLIGEAPLIDPLELAAGRHRLLVVADGYYPFSAELDLSRGADLTVHAELELTMQRRVSLGLFGVATALLIAGASSGAIALVADADARAVVDRLEARQGLRGRDELADYQSARALRGVAAPLSAALLSAAVVSGLSGLGLFLLDAPHLSAGPGGASVQGSF